MLNRKHKIIIWVDEDTKIKKTEEIVTISEKIKCVTYHIYWNTETEGKIEKHIPQEITEGYENKYAYTYHDKEGNEHDVGIFDYKRTIEMLPGNIKGKKEIELIDIRQFTGYESRDKKIKAKFLTWNSSSQRWFINPDCLASLLAAMLDLNIDYLGFNGFSTYDAKSIKSCSHINGWRGDLRYLSKNKEGEITYLQHDHFDYEKQVSFNKTLYKYGWGRNKNMLSEYFSYQGIKNTLLPYTTHYAQGETRHYHHLHLQGYNFLTIKKIEIS